MHAQEPGVVAVTHLMGIECPVPGKAGVIVSAFDRGAMKQVRLVLCVANDGGAPPIRKRSGGVVSLVLVAMRRKCIPVFIGVQLHVQSDLPQIVQAGGSIRLRFGFCQSRQQHGREDGDDRDNHEQFD